MAAPTNEFPNLALIRQGVDHRFKIRCRALELQVRPLAISEEDQIAQDVAEQMDKLPPPRQTTMRQSMLFAIKKLELAQTSAVGMHDQKIQGIELEKMTAGEVDYLFKQYIAACDKVNPVFERLDADRLAGIVENLKKSSKDMEMTLIESSFFHLVDLCLHLLNQGASPTARSSG